MCRTLSRRGHEFYPTPTRRPQSPSPLNIQSLLKVPQCRGERRWNPQAPVAWVGVLVGAAAVAVVVAVLVVVAVAAVAGRALVTWA